jgi:ABC-type Fe3+ transport system permease subunit
MKRPKGYGRHRLNLALLTAAAVLCCVFGGYFIGVWWFNARLDYYRSLGGALSAEDLGRVVAKAIFVAAMGAALLTALVVGAIWLIARHFSFRFKPFEYLAVRVPPDRKTTLPAARN